MYPFFHPTTLVVVDDDVMLLKSFEMLYGDDYPCVTFSDPRDAIAFLQSHEDERVRGEDFVFPYSDVYSLESLKEGELFLKLSTSKLSSLMENKKRFCQNSVVIIDYELPFVNGLEFCRKISHLPVRKIMLTGQASHNQAIQAFNENLIDCFLGKSEQNLTEKLLHEMKVQEQKYFNVITAPLKLALSLPETSFLKDPALEGIFYEITRQNAICEYYLNTHPPGFFMFQENGTPFFLLIYPKERMRAHFEIAQDASAPNDLLECLSNCQKVPLFPTQSGYYEAYVRENWKSYLWSAQHVQGHSDWYVALIKGETFLYDSLTSYCSYEEHKKELDQNKTIY